MTYSGDTPPGTRPDRVSFDEQAGVFEARAGLPDGVPAQVAAAVVAYAGLDPGDLLVEIGAGTGLIGQWLARAPLRYVGLDSSQPMLDVFAPRLPPGTALVRADADRPWPVADGSARAVFGSRVFQLLDVDNLVREARRVARAGGAVLVAGRLERAPDSPKVRVRARLHQLLADRGLSPRPAGRLLRRVLAHAQAAGGESLAPITVATWQRQVRPGEVLDEWRQKWSIGGLTPPPEVHAAVLAELSGWVAEQFGDPHTPVPTSESFVLEGARIDPQPEGE